MQIHGAQLILKSKGLSDELFLYLPAQWTLKKAVEQFGSAFNFEGKMWTGCLIRHTHWQKP